MQCKTNAQQNKCTLLDRLNDNYAPYSPILSCSIFLYFAQYDHSSGFIFFFNLNH